MMRTIEERFWLYINDKISKKPINVNLYDNEEVKIFRKVASENRILFLINDDFSDSSFDNLVVTNAKKLLYDNTLFELNKIFKEFDKNDIKYVVYKGAINNMILFHSYVREFSDIDILIDKKDFYKAWQILYKNGYLERDDEDNESEIFDYKLSYGSAQFIKSNNNYILGIDVHTNVPFLSGLTNDILDSRKDFLINNDIFKIPDETYYFLLMIINFYDNFCTRFGILYNYRFIDIYECIFFYKKYKNTICINKIITIFESLKRMDIINYFFIVLNIFSDDSFELELSMSKINDNNSPKYIYSDADYLCLDVKKSMFSRKTRLIDYNNNVRIKKPDYYFYDISNPPLIVETYNNVYEIITDNEKYSMQSTTNNKNDVMVYYNVGQNDQYFFIIFRDLLVLNNHVVELCLFNNEVDSEELNKIYSFDIVSGKLVTFESDISAYCSGTDVIFSIPLSYMSVQEDKYVLLSFLIWKKISKRLKIVILGSGWYTSPVKYYIR